jgi:hypothetical protein
MEIIKITIEFETRYVSNDGEKWKCQKQCEQYEQLLADPSPLHELAFYDVEGEPLDVFALKDIPAFSYLVLKNDIERYDPEVVKTIIGYCYNSNESFHLPTTKGIWYNDWANARNGSYGFNGWVRCDTIDTLLIMIEECQNKIKLFQQIGG